jgi:hypothetical protein
MDARSGSKDFWRQVKISNCARCRARDNTLLVQVLVLVPVPSRAAHCRWVRPTVSTYFYRFTVASVIIKTELLMKHHLLQHSCKTPLLFNSSLTVPLQPVPTPFCYFFFHYPPISIRARFAIGQPWIESRLVQNSIHGWPKTKSSIPPLISAMNIVDEFVNDHEIRRRFCSLVATNRRIV